MGGDGRGDEHRLKNPYIYAFLGRKATNLAGRRKIRTLPIYGVLRSGNCLGDGDAREEDNEVSIRPGRH